MRQKILILSIVLLNLTSYVWAQPQHGSQRGMHGGQGFAFKLFPPEMVMRNSSTLNLNEDQKNKIKETIKQTESESLDIKWELRDESEQMANLLSESVVEETRLLKQADKVMALENKMKKMQLSMLVRIKNLLTPEQQQQLQEIRKQRRKGMDYHKVPQ